MRLNSIRARMTVSFALSIALLMVVVCGGVIHFSYATEVNSADTLLHNSATKVRNELVVQHDVISSGALEEERDLRADGLSLLIVNPSGKLIRKPSGQAPSWPSRKDDGWRTAEIPKGGYTFIIGIPWRKTERALENQAKLLVLVGVVVTVGATIGAWLLVGKTLSPIGALSRRANAELVESLKVRLESPSQDAEMVELVETLNGLLARVAETAESKGRFYAAASHELRTPLQALSGHLELALSRERTGEEYHETVQEANQQTRRLTSLVQDLLELNQLDTAKGLPESDHVDVVDACERALAQWSATIEQKALRIDRRLGTRCELFAPRNHVEMVIRNLVENAVRYTPDEGEIQIRLSCSTPVALSIFNTCLPLSQKDASRLFEPFYRPDVSRNSQTGGNGLGLAICKAAADANGWGLNLEALATGVQVTLTFSLGRSS
jgi:signal transduction histidine kinase